MSFALSCRTCATSNSEPPDSTVTVGQWGSGTDGGAPDFARACVHAPQLAARLIHAAPRPNWGSNGVGSAPPSAETRSPGRRGEEGCTNRWSPPWGGSNAVVRPRGAVLRGPEGEAVLGRLDQRLLG